MSKQLDYKWIGMIVIICLTFSAVGYGFTLLVSSLNDPEKVKSFDCNTLTEDQWHKDPSGGGFRTLDEYKAFCVKDKQVILNQPQSVGIAFVIGIPITVGIVIGKVFGIYKDEDEQPKSKGVKQDV